MTTDFLCAVEQSCSSLLFPVRQSQLQLGRVSVYLALHGTCFFCFNPSIFTRRLPMMGLHMNKLPPSLSVGGSVIEWLGRRTHDSRIEGSPPGHDTAWLFISETGDGLWRVNCLGNCNHHLGQLSLAFLRGR